MKTLEQCYEEQVQRRREHVQEVDRLFEDALAAFANCDDDKLGIAIWRLAGYARALADISVAEATGKLLAERERKSTEKMTWFSEANASPSAVPDLRESRCMVVAGGVVHSASCPNCLASDMSCVVFEPKEEEPHHG